MIPTTIPTYKEVLQRVGVPDATIEVLVRMYRKLGLHYVVVGGAKLPL